MYKNEAGLKSEKCNGRSPKSEFLIITQDR